MIDITKKDIIKYPPVASMEVGSTIQIPCHSLTPHVQWSLNGEFVPRKSKFATDPRYGINYLILENAAPLYSGVYTCITRDQNMSYVYSEIFLIIYGKF